MIAFFLVLLGSMACCAWTQSYRLKRRFIAASKRSTDAKENFRKGAPPGVSAIKIILSIVTLAASWYAVAHMRETIPSWVSLIVSFASFAVFYLTVEGDWFMRSSIAVSYGIRGGLLTVIAFGLCIYGYQDYTTYVEKKATLAARKEALEAQRELARQMTELERNWEPGHRVAERSQGALIAFLVHDTELLVDWTFETKKENAGKARRHVPIDIVLLNNSFKDLHLDKDAKELWNLTIRNANNDVVRRYSTAMGLNYSLYPAERIHGMVDWDGCDSRGALVPPGNYAFVCVVANPRSHEAIVISRNFEVINAGPIKKVIASQQSELQAFQNKVDSMNATIESMNQQLLDMQRFQRQMEEMQRNMNRRGPLYR